ncbi:MAG: hypothetical protein MJZ38_05910 [archaeon]|nr:hypothetical protein [archaeon]
MMSGSILSMLDPDLVVQEALYGFIMALTLVLTCQLGIAHYDSRETLILAIVGMDFVWGAIDMVVFYRVDILAHSRRVHLYLKVREATDREEQIRLLEHEFDGTVFRMGDVSNRRRMIEEFLDGDFTGLNDLQRDRRHYLFNAVTAFVVSVSTVIPVILCLVLVEDQTMSLLFSSTLSSLALFFIGYAISPSDNRGYRVGTGLSIATIGLVFTVVAALLGG